MDPHTGPIQLRGYQPSRLAATERYMFAENMQGRPSRYPGHGRELAHGYQNALGYLEGMHAETAQILGKVGDSGLETRIITPAPVSMTMWKWLRAMANDEPLCSEGLA